MLSLSQANPKVGKDQPPDLAALVPSEAINSTNASQPEASPQEPKQNHVTVNSKPATVDKGTIANVYFLLLFSLGVLYVELWDIQI